MAYSFIEPPKRSPFGPTVRRVWIAGGVLLVVTLALAAFIHLQNSDLEAELAKQKEKQRTLSLQNEQLAKRVALHERQMRRLLQVSTANELLADQLFDLLDLVPDDATLQRFERNEKGVLFAGECRNYPALKRQLEQALSGEYRLQNEQKTSEGERVRFTLYFGKKGAAQ
jgi:hypothetical protein